MPSVFSRRLLHELWLSTMEKTDEDESLAVAPGLLPRFRWPPRALASVVVLFLLFALALLL